MKLRTPERPGKRRTNAREVLAVPETEDKYFTQLEQVFEQDRAEAIRTIEKNIREIQGGRPFSLTDLGRSLGAVLILEQVFSEPILGLALRQQAIEALRSPGYYVELKSSIESPVFDLQELWYQAAVIQLYPEDREAVGLSDKVIDEWLGQFLAGQDQLTYEAKPFALSLLAQLRPDRKRECREVLEKIGYDQEDLGEEAWSARSQLMKNFNESTAEALVGTRLLQPERAFSETEKQGFLRAFGGRGRLIGLSWPLSQYAKVAILLAPSVDITSDGKIILGETESMGQRPELPERPL